MVYLRFNLQVKRIKYTNGVITNKVKAHILIVNVVIKIIKIQLKIKIKQPLIYFKFKAEDAGLEPTRESPRPQFSKLANYHSCNLPVN